MSARIPTKYANRDVAARKLAALLRYKIAPGMAFETYTAFADAIALPADGNIPVALRARIEDYLAPPLEPDKEVYSQTTTIQEEL